MRLVVALVLTGLAGFPASARAGSGWEWPVRGALLARFHTGPDPFAAGQHRGIDIVAPPGAAVRSACAGRVRFAGTAGTGGRTVSVRCGALVATYLHLAAIAVREGQAVAAGRRLGSVGTSGRPRSPAPHLHFGVRVAARRWSYVDPLALLGDASAPAPVPLLPALRRPPRGLGPVPRARVPRPVPAAARVPRVLGSVPAGSGLPWSAWAGIGLICLALPLGGLGIRRRTSALRVGRGAPTRPAPAGR